MNQLEKGKATITGDYARVSKSIKNDFDRKCKDSNIKGNESQSQREVIIEKLKRVYIENGDACFDFIFKN